MAEPNVRLEKWSPADAEKALAKNRVNRRLREGKITQYSRDMRENRWTACPAPISFDEEGNLLDGQHRLTAQVKAGKDITWVVMRDLPTEVQQTIDTGAPRSLSDLMAVKGVSGSRTTGAVARLCLQIESGRIHSQARDRVASSIEIMEFYEKNPEIEISTQVASHVVKTGILNTAPSPLGAAHWWIAKHVGMSEATEFLERLGALTHEEDGSPVIALVKRLNDINRKGIRVEPRWVIYMVVKCWNYDVKGMKIYKINAMTRDGEYKLLTPHAKAASLEDDDINDAVADDE